MTPRSSLFCALASAAALSAIGEACAGEPAALTTLSAQRLAQSSRQDDLRSPRPVPGGLPGRASDTDDGLTKRGITRGAPVRATPPASAPSDKDKEKSKGKKDE